jgi:hypothetical protein
MHVSTLTVDDNPLRVFLPTRLTGGSVIMMVLKRLDVGLEGLCMRGILAEKEGRVKYIEVAGEAAVSGMSL